MAEENRTWGYERIQGALKNPGHDVSPNTVANILKRHGIEPAPTRKTKTTWKEFLQRHADQLAATDFFSVEVWTKAGLQRFLVLFYGHLFASRPTRRHREMSEWSIDGADCSKHHRWR